MPGTLVVAFKQEGGILGGRRRPLGMVVVHGVVVGVVVGADVGRRRWERVGALAGGDIAAGLLERRGGKIDWSGEEGVEGGLRAGARDGRLRVRCRHAESVGRRGTERARRPQPQRRVWPCLQPARDRPLSRRVTRSSTQHVLIITAMTRQVLHTAQVSTTPGSLLQGLPATPSTTG